ncbi:hypothetical protein [Ruminococcus sp.]|uniref:hypothetical protein n=1 Tax=Ruminococcus sp. TaxID=41978 RepID=UPI0025CB8491|nr:hypothetical protein [Ruminococcus sp.]MBQ8968019.1 hypothetical protein [Ruminococcus sp.]
MFYRSDPYGDIKHLSRPDYEELPPMTRHDRAAQFSPFAALTGYDEAVEETARFTDSRRELTEDDMDKLNAALCELADILPDRPVVSVKYFVPDSRKAGGSYVNENGAVRIIDSYENSLVFTDGRRIPIGDICELSIIKDEI